VGRRTGKINLSLRRAAGRYDKDQDLSLQEIMAYPIGGTAYLMIDVISAHISGM
jgi:hypothetical protein